jgi:hypothetical protein
MATNKKKRIESKAIITMVPRVKFVRAANMWCRTYRDDKGIQKQEWFSNVKEQ